MNCFSRESLCDGVIFIGMLANAIVVALILYIYVM